MRELNQNANIKFTVIGFAILAMIIVSVTGVYFSLKGR